MSISFSISVENYQFYKLLPMICHFTTIFSIVHSSTDPSSLIIYIRCCKAFLHHNVQHHSVYYYYNYNRNIYVMRESVENVFEKAKDPFVYVNNEIREWKCSLQQSASYWLRTCDSSSLPDNTIILLYICAEWIWFIRC